MDTSGVMCGPLPPSQLNKLARPGSWLVSCAQGERGVSSGLDVWQSDRIAGIGYRAGMCFLVMRVLPGARGIAPPNIHTNLPCRHLISSLPRAFELLSSPYLDGLHPPCYSRPSVCESAWNPLFSNTLYINYLYLPLIVKLLSLSLL